MKKTLLSFIAGLFLLSSLSLSISMVAAEDFEIIPQADDQSKVGQEVRDISVGGEVRDKYDEQAAEYESNGDIGEAFASGVFTRNLVLDYVVYGIRFLSQIGILIGAIMIIYAGYIYASSIFTGKETGGGKKAITNAITGVLVVAFSYAIMKLVTSAFIS